MIGISLLGQTLDYMKNTLKTGFGDEWKCSVLESHMQVIKWAPTLDFI